MLGLLQNNVPATKIADMALEIEFTAFDISPDQVSQPERNGKPEHADQRTGVIRCGHGEKSQRAHPYSPRESSAADATAANGRSGRTHGAAKPDTEWSAQRNAARSSWSSWPNADAAAHESHGAATAAPPAATAATTASAAPADSDDEHANASSPRTNSSEPRPKSKPDAASANAATADARAAPAATTTRPKRIWPAHDGAG